MDVHYSLNQVCYITTDIYCSLIWLDKQGDTDLYTPPPFFSQKKFVLFFLLFFIIHPLDVFLKPFNAALQIDAAASSPAHISSDMIPFIFNRELFYMTCQHQGSIWCMFWICWVSQCCRVNIFYKSWNSTPKYLVLTISLPLTLYP